MVKVVVWFRIISVAVLWLSVLYCSLSYLWHADGAWKITGSSLIAIPLAFSEFETCMTLNMNFSFIFESAARARHRQAIHTEIWKVIPSHYAVFCWLTYCGPWIEEIWMSEASRPITDFGPFVPLFLPWTKLWVGFMSRYWGFTSSIFRLMSSDFLYCTLNHNDDGLEGKENSDLQIPSNMFVLSQGGKGHVPLLLWLNPRAPDDYPLEDSYAYVVCFMGALWTHGIRTNMANTIRHRFPTSSIVSSGDWVSVYRKSRFVLTPRGHGRNSYRLAEVLQMGLLPVYVYSDIVWLPYYDSINWSSFSIVTHVDRLNMTLDFMDCQTPAMINQMKMKVRSLYDSHFSARAHFRHIMMLLKYGFQMSDLRCSLYSHNSQTLSFY